MQLTPPQQQLALEYASAVIRSRLAGEPLPPAPPGEGELFEMHAGCFVTLHTLTAHRLRGCIGRLVADEPFVQTLQEMAEAVLEDSRFADDPVALAELPELEIEITILSPLEEAAGPLDFDLLEHGIYLQHSGRAGCFLPQVARETGWDRPTLLARLCSEKMGLPADAWRQPGAKLLRFTATIVGPRPMSSL